MKKSRVASNALNNPKAGYSQLARLEPTAFWKRSRRLQLTALEQLSLLLDSKAKNRPTHKKADTTFWAASIFFDSEFSLSTSFKRLASLTSICPKLILPPVERHFRDVGLPAHLQDGPTSVGPV
jgi:hypothetical protein